MRRAAMILVCAAILPACSERGAPPPSGPPRLTSVQGMLAVAPPSALPDEGRAVVELRDAAGKADGPALAEQRIPLRGDAPPVRFALTVDPARLRADGTYTVRAAVLEKGRPTWVSDAVPVDPLMQQIDLGELRMTRHMALAFATTLRCGERGEIQFGVHQETMHVVAGEESIPLRPVASAPSGHYEAAGDRTTTFTITGDRARFVVRGEAWPECVPVKTP